jgi:hypothetical protein
MAGRFQTKSVLFREYKYVPLLDPLFIRLLKLQPDSSGPETSQICITLQEISLDDHISYESVSYTWASEYGDQERSSPIECNKDGFIMVTTNCEAALRRLRLTESVRILWLDAICINQDDSTERIQQVILMRAIYSNVSNVLVWLGKASVKCDPETLRPYLDIGIDYLYWLGVEAIERASEKPDSDYHLTGSMYSAVRELRSREPDDAVARSPEFRGLMKILSYSFWNRVWVIQELALPPSIVLFCGDAVLQGSKLQALAEP